MFSSPRTSFLAREVWFRAQVERYRKTQPQLLFVSVKSCEAVLQTCLCPALTRVWVPPNIFWES